MIPYKKKKTITIENVKKEKRELDTIFTHNWTQASYQQRITYQINRPFQFIYKKLTGPNASYLERFAYGAAVAAGIAVTGYGIYKGIKFTQLYLENQNKSLEDLLLNTLPKNYSELLTTPTTMASKEEILQKLQSSNHFTDNNYFRDENIGKITTYKELLDIVSSEFGGSTITPLEAMKKAEDMTNSFFASHGTTRESYHILDNAWDLLGEIFQDDSGHMTPTQKALMEFYNNKRSKLTRFR